MNNFLEMKVVAENNGVLALCELTGAKQGLLQFAKKKLCLKFNEMGVIIGTVISVNENLLNPSLEKDFNKLSKVLTFRNSSLELAAQTESLLNLYMAAKKELNTHLGFTADVSKFPVVESIREQIKIVRESSK